MLITNHAIAGTVVGRFTRRPVRALGLGVVGHVLQDLVPHWGTRTPLRSREFITVAVIDGLTGLAVSAVLLRRAAPDLRTAVATGIVGSCLIDFDKPGRIFFGRSPFPQWFDDWHARIQNEDPGRMPMELGWAVASLAVAAWLLRR